MALSNLFKINTTDLTKYEDATQHDVNRADIWAEWTDGNWVTHRIIGRTRVSGTVVLNFSRQADFNTFISLLSSERNANGYYPISVYCSNTGTTESVDAFLDVAGSTAWDVTAPIKHHSVTITITGR